MSHVGTRRAMGDGMTARTYYEPIAPGGYRRSPIATRRLVREWLDAAGNVVRVEVVCEVAS